jgi:hypothetical protein
VKGLNLRHNRPSIYAQSNGEVGLSLFLDKAIFRDDAEDHATTTCTRYVRMSRARLVLRQSEPISLSHIILDWVERASQGLYAGWFMKYGITSVDLRPCWFADRGNLDRW